MKRMIYTTGEVYVISEDDVWMPGAYADCKTAARAFDYPDHVLQALMEVANDRAGGFGGVITAKDLDNYRDLLK